MSCILKWYSQQKKGTNEEGQESSALISSINSVSTWCWTAQEQGWRSILTLQFERVPVCVCGWIFSYIFLRDSCVLVPALYMNQGYTPVIPNRQSPDLVPDSLRQQDLGHMMRAPESHWQKPCFSLSHVIASLSGQYIQSHHLKMSSVSMLP